MNIQIDYNTVTFESKVNCNDETILSNLEQTIEDNRNKRITDWFESFLNRVKEESNNDPFSIDVSGCDFYEKEILESLIKNEKEFIYNKRINCIEEDILKNKYVDIDNFLNFSLQSDSILVKEAIEPNVININKLRENKVEVPVIATMSSGKSTLLNALIGQNFLFEDTGAATATTCNIKVNNKLKLFKAQAIDNEVIIEEEHQDISTFLEKWNSRANKTNFSNLRLNIEGPVKNLSSSELELNFIDTPGPNSAQYKTHKGKTYHYLKDHQNLPIVLYVLDPEKMESQDDDKTLEEISNVLKKNKQDLDRIIFIYNKIDREEIEKKTFAEVLTKIHKFLGKYNIENPKIFPVSAKYAKLAQLEHSLSRNEKRDLENYRFKFIPDENYDGYQLLENSPLSQIQKEILRNRISESELDADLVHSGLAAIKLYIKDYIINHHQKNQYKDILNIANKVADLLENKIELEKTQLNEKTAEAQNEWEYKSKIEIEELLNKKIQALKSIDKIELDKGFIQETIKDIDKDFTKLKINSQKKRKLSTEDAIDLIEKANDTIANLLVRIETDLFSRMNDEGKVYLDKLKNEVAEKFKLNDSSLEIKTFNSEILNRVNVLDIKSIERHKKVNVETKYLKKNKKIKSKNWFKRMLGITDVVEYKVPYKVSKTEIDSTQLYNDTIAPIIKKVSDIVKETKTKFDEMSREYNDSFQSLVNTSFDLAMNSVYENTQKVLAGNLNSKQNSLNELNEISKPVLKFKQNQTNEKIHRKQVSTY